MEGIVSQLVVREHINENARRQADAQAKNVDEGIELVLHQIAQRDFEVVFEHNLVPCCWLLITGLLDAWLFILINSLAPRLIRT